VKQSPTVWALVDAEVDALDKLVGALRSGIRDQRHFDQLAGDADGIGKRLRAAFRGNQT
jgi:hypothetical protein